MPRARINDATEDIVLPKTRARRTRAVESGEEKPAPRKRAAPRPRAVATSIEPSPRKAPTDISYKRRSHSRKTKSLFVVVGICLVLTGIGVGIGLMDRGAIDVVAVVNERNEKINKGEVRDESGNAITQTLQVQSDTRPNGGLPMGEAVETPPAPVASTTTEATSTDETATSTEVIETEATTTEESV
jgi:hypothetical protein